MLACVLVVRVSASQKALHPTRVDLSHIYRLHWLVLRPATFPLFQAEANGKARPNNLIMIEE